MLLKLSDAMLGCSVIIGWKSCTTFVSISDDAVDCASSAIKRFSINTSLDVNADSSAIRRFLINTILDVHEDSATSAEN